MVSLVRWVLLFAVTKSDDARDVLLISFIYADAPKSLHYNI